MIFINKVSTIFFFFIFSLLFLSIQAAGLDTVLTLDIIEDWVIVAATAEFLEGDAVLSSLEEGLKAEIFFQFRVYASNKGIFSILGDRLVSEKSMTFVAFKDFFMNQYVVQMNDNEFIYYDNSDDFLTGFTHLSNFHLIDMKTLDTADYYLLARISIYPVKLEPPLHIIALINPIGSTSPWVEYKFSELKKDF